MKVLKFNSQLVPLILNGSKTSTWRLFDDKELVAGDYIELRVFGDLESFAIAKISSVKELQFKDLTVEDKLGHEQYQSDKEMYATYSKYYQTPIGPNDSLKIIHFELSK